MGPNDLKYDVTMRSQVLEKTRATDASRKLVDLNCGRYCAESVLRWTKMHNNVTLPEGNIFYEVLPNGRADRKERGWDPGKDGTAYFEVLKKPDDSSDPLEAWINLLRERGPVIISGKLGLAKMVPIFDIGHYLLVIGVFEGHLIYKDPLAGDDVKKLSTVDLYKIDKKVIVLREQWCRRA